MESSGISATHIPAIKERVYELWTEIKEHKYTLQDGVVHLPLFDVAVLEADKKIIKQIELQHERDRAQARTSTSEASPLVEEMHAHQQGEERSESPPATASSDKDGEGRHGEGDEGAESQDLLDQVLAKASSKRQRGIGDGEPSSSADSSDSEDDDSEEESSDEIDDSNADS